MNKRGISAIVATVLVILITVAGIGIIWVAIVPMISDAIVFDALEGRVSVVSAGGYTLYDSSREVAIVQVKRDVDDGVMDRIKISFVIEGNSVSSNVVAPDSGAMKVYSFDLSGLGTPESVEVAPIFVSGSSEKVGSVTSNVDLGSGVIERVRGNVYGVGGDYFSEVPTDGLISMWTFSGDADDGWGDNDGSLEGDANTDGGVLNLDGSGYVDIGNVGSSYTDALTISAWVKTAVMTEGVDYGFIYSGGAAAGMGGFYVRIQDSGSPYSPRFAVSNGITREIGVFSVPILEDEWVLVTLIVDSSGRYLYYDGVLQESIVGLSGTYDTAVDFNIGCGASCGEFFNGAMDNVMVFNRALSGDEVVAIYDAQKRGS